MADKKNNNKLKTGKIGIVGGKGVGKSYLFQAIVYRTYSPEHAGALSYFIQKGTIELHSALFEQRDKAEKEEVKLIKFIDDYQAWIPLAQTTIDSQIWYWLTIPYSKGLFGKGKSQLEIEFLDGSGEFISQELNEDNRPIWEAYKDAQVMVFCLPLWVAFPDPENFEQDKDDFTTWLDNLISFEGIVDNYKAIIKDVLSDAQRQKIKIILALTMADDKKSALKNLRSKWIVRFLENEASHLSSLRKDGRAIMRYLEQAGKISNLLHEEFNQVGDPRRSRIPDSLKNINDKRPWIIPVSAIEGRMLNAPDSEKRGKFPAPVHVELPLLVALCEQTNALM